MPAFVKLSAEQRNTFFSKIKLQLGGTWKNVYLKKGISKAMFYNYLSGKFPIPKNLFEEWQDKASIPSQNIKILNKQKYLKKEIPKIKLDGRLAEILGILNGDGHICPINHEICVVGNCLEKEYADHIKKLFETKFNIPFNLFFDNSKFKLRGYSIDLFNILTKKYRLPSGNKMGNLRIPLQVITSRRLLVSYIRGLFDTDGTFYIRRKKDAVIEISSADKVFLKEIHEALCSIGFNFGLYQKHINLYDLRSIKRFFKIVRPSNPKHLKKFIFYNKDMRGWSNGLRQ